MNRATLDDKRVWIGGGVLVALIIVAASWLLFIHPKLSSSRELRSQATSTDQQNDQLAGKVSTLKRQNQHMTDLQHKLATAIDTLPPINALPEFTREVSALARLESVSLTSINIGNPTPLQDATAAAPETDPDPASTDTDSTGTEPADTSAPTSAPTSDTASSQTPYSIAVTLETSGTSAHQAAFLYALQHGARGALVSSVQVSGTSAGRATMNTQFDIYTAPATKAQLTQLRHLLSSASS